MIYACSNSTGTTHLKLWHPIWTFAGTTLFFINLLTLLQAHKTTTIRRQTNLVIFSSKNSLIHLFPPSDSSTGIILAYYARGRNWNRNRNTPKVGIYTCQAKKTSYNQLSPLIKLWSRDTISFTTPRPNRINSKYPVRKRLILFIRCTKHPPAHFMSLN